MQNILKRPRRLRETENIRRLVRETKLTIDDFIYPMFIVEGNNIKKEVPSMPNVFQMSIDIMEEELKEVQDLGIPGVMLFGIPDKKDALGSGAYDDQGIVQRALRLAKEKYQDLILAADVCLCEYTDHGHCGVINNKRVENDETVKLLVKSALSFAKAGADIIAPSDMMDGRVGVIRRALDENRYTDKIIMSYSAKYASSFYSPFRDAAQSKPSFGDRKSYQMDFCNIKEAILEVEADIQEGADIVMIKPAIAYLDVIKEIRNKFYTPIAAYSVSGEYSMIKAASLNGWIDEKRVVIETMTSIKRAGADIIISYFAKDIAKWIG